jgi:hypothetical protein
VITTAGKFRVVVFVSKVEIFYILVQAKEQTGRGRKERRRAPPL